MVTHIVRVIIGLLGVGLTALIFIAIDQQAPDSSLAQEVGALLEPTWGYVTFADLYLGFLICAAFIVAAERRLWAGLAWALPIFFLGNVVTAAWVAIRLPGVVRRLRA